MTKPIAYVSYKLSPAEQTYLHLNKKVLAIGLGIQKFYQYLFGKIFIIYMDHYLGCDYYAPKIKHYPFKQFPIILLIILAEFTNCCQIMLTLFPKIYTNLLEYLTLKHKTSDW